MHNRKIFLLFLLCFIYTNVDGQPITVDVNWNNITYTSNTIPTLQVVVNPLYERSSPIHDGTFSALSMLGADFVRFQGWQPYPQLVVAELQPPSGNPVCASAVEGQSLTLSCYEGVFESIDFASFGISEGRCDNFTMGKCSSPNSLSVVKSFCLGKPNCTIPNNSTVFGGDPCMGSLKRLTVQATCSISVNKTFWNFTLMDPIFEDFMDATNGHPIILNMCTSPQWLWNSPTPVVYPADPNEPYWSYDSGSDLRDPTFQDITDYYKRVFQWYTQGGFVDEYGVYHKSGYNYNIPMWEMFNELDLGNRVPVQYYTKMYDAISAGIKEIQPNIQFVGLALGSPSLNIINSLNWLEYFLNQSNHQQNASLDWISYHFYALPISRNNTDGFESFFPMADYFFWEVSQIEIIRKQLAPWVKTTIDELGVILPNDNDNNPPPGPIPNIYWNAAGAMYAYIYANIILQGIEVLGESQMIGYPGQYPSVSMMDWTTGKPNARYWVLYLLHSYFHVGDRLTQTSSSNSTALFSQGFATTTGNVILVVNKLNKVVNVTISGLSSGEITYVDETTSEAPPATIRIANAFSLNPFSVGVVHDFN